MRSVEVVLALVLGASLVAAIAAKARAPAPSLLVAAGVAVGLVPGVPVPRLTPELVLLVVLPPLLSAAAEQQNWLAIRNDWRPVSALAIGLVVISAGLTAVAAAPLLHVSGAVALVLGAILASTDPVAVTALARSLRLPERLETIVAAESLANDATSLLMFSLGLGLVTHGGAIRPGHLLGQLGQLAGIGLAVGAAVALAAGGARSRTADPVAHSVLSLVTPFAAYVAADACGGSGVTAVVVAGLITGTRVNRRVPPPVRLQLQAVNDTVVFLLESVIFALIGLQLPALVSDLDAAASRWVVPALALAGVLIGVRFLGVAPVVYLTRRRVRSSGAAPVGPSGLRNSLVLTWAGTRGVVPLAAALSLPLTVDGGGPFPDRTLLVLVATSVCVVSLVVQGLTLAPLTRHTGVVEVQGRAEALTERGRAAMQAAARARFAALASAEAAPAAVLEELQRLLELRDPGVPADGTFARDVRHLGQDLLRAERHALDDLHRNGQLSDDVWRSLGRSLDLDAASLGE